jgi:uncharacterized protein YbcI
MYLQGTGRISNCLTRLLHDVLGCTPATILTTFFCKVKIFSLYKELTPKNHSILYNRMKVCIVNLFEGVNVTDMAHRPNMLHLT